MAVEAVRSRPTRVVATVVFSCCCPRAGMYRVCSQRRRVRGRCSFNCRWSLLRVLSSMLRRVLLSKRCGTQWEISPWHDDPPRTHMSVHSHTLSTADTRSAHFRRRHFFSMPMQMTLQVVFATTALTLRGVDLVHTRRGGFAALLCDSVLWTIHDPLSVITTLICVQCCAEHAHLHNTNFEHVRPIHIRTIQVLLRMHSTPFLCAGAQTVCTPPCHK